MGKRESYGLGNVVNLPTTTTTKTPAEEYQYVSFPKDTGGGEISIPSVQVLPTGGQDVSEFVHTYGKMRDTMGEQSYGTPLKTFNGRDPLLDMLDEQYDGLKYTAQQYLQKQKLRSVIDAFLSNKKVQLNNAPSRHGLEIIIYAYLEDTSLDVALKEAWGCMDD